jgi:hypothetical protein
MISKNNYWCEVFPVYDDGSLSVGGKWLYFDEVEKVHSFLETLNQLVESGSLQGAKIARKLPEFDPFPEKPCVLCVYTTSYPDDKERVRELLRERLGISVSLWKSEIQTREDWKEGGLLKLQSEIRKIIRAIEDGTEENVEAAQNHVIELSHQLKEVIKNIDDPNRLVEVSFDLIDEVQAKTKSNLARNEGTLEVILSRLVKLEGALTNVSAKLSSGEVSYQREEQVEDSNSVFVIMPFAEEHVDTYDAIRRAVGRMDPNLEAQRVDEKPGAHIISEEIHRSIRRASLVICDVTDDRPNVYYELGFAMGMNKKVICIAHKGTVVHFDVYGLKIIYFRTLRELEETLLDEMQKLIGAYSST